MDYYRPPGLFPYAVPAVLGLMILAYANFGFGIYAERFREWIFQVGGKWLLPLANGFMLLMVGHLTPSPRKITMGGF